MIHVDKGKMAFEGKLELLCAEFEQVLREFRIYNCKEFGKENGMIIFNTVLEASKESEEASIEFIEDLKLKLATKFMIHDLRSLLDMMEEKIDE